MHPLVIAITGASGAIYSMRLLDAMLRSGRDVHLTISTSGRAVIQQELNLAVDLSDFDPPATIRSLRDANCGASEYQLTIQQIADSLADSLANGSRLVYHRHQDFMSPIASGSFLTDGMVICPCSGTTMSAVAHGTSNNLIQRAADVHLKEKRKLIVVPRETPLSTIQLENMSRVSQAGAVVLPAMPGWYHGVQSITDLVDFVVARILDHLGVEHRLTSRWGTESE